jgi:hypothetical protein
MKNITKEKASDAILEQHMMIEKAIRLLQSDLEALEGTVSPNSESWVDVAKFAKTADIARGIINSYTEK